MTWRKTLLPQRQPSREKLFGVGELTAGLAHHAKVAQTPRHAKALWVDLGEDGMGIAKVLFRLIQVSLILLENSDTDLSRRQVFGELAVVWVLLVFRGQHAQAG